MGGVPLALARKGKGVEMVMAETYMPTRGSMGDIDPTIRREALVTTHDAMPVAERERIDGMVQALSTKYNNVGRLIALEILAAIGIATIGIGLDKEGYGNAVSIPAI